MRPQPESVMAKYRASDRLHGKVALISGGDLGLGRAVAAAFAKEGADVAIVYLDEHDDAQETLCLVEAEGRHGLLIAGDVGNSDFCREAARQAVAMFGRVDVLVNNAAEQHLVEKLEDLSDEQLERTFRTNIFSQFYLTRAVLPHMPDGGAIVNTTSVAAYQGNPDLLDYSSTKGAIVAFTRALSKQLLQRGIRVNGVAPGPIWTPLISRQLSAGEDGQARQQCADGAAGTAGRGGALLHLPGLRRCILYDRANSASERRHRRQRLTTRPPRHDVVGEPR